MAAIDKQTTTIPLLNTSPLSPSQDKALALITASHGLHFRTDKSEDEIGQTSSPVPMNLLRFLLNLSGILADNNEPNIALAISEATHQATLSPDFGGYGLGDEADVALTASDEAKVLFLLSAYLEAMNCAERAKHAPEPLTQRPAGRRGMTMTEKILAMHDVQHKGWVKPGEVVQVDVDWVIASELSWAVSLKLCPYTTLVSFMAD
jgi:hypothetical protein